MFTCSVANKIKMGKKLEKGLKEKNPSAVSQDEENPNKTPGEATFNMSFFYLNPHNQYCIKNSTCRF